jgi:hypothetical protein
MAFKGLTLAYLEPVAGLYGNRIDAVAFRRGHPFGQSVRWIRCPHVDEPPTDHPDELTSPDTERKCIECILGRYAESNRFTEKQLRTIRAVWLDHEPLRSIAHREGVSRQAILARVDGVLKKAPEFAADWPHIKRVERFW